MFLIEWINSELSFFLLTLSWLLAPFEGWTLYFTTFLSCYHVLLPSFSLLTGEGVDDIIRKYQIILKKKACAIALKNVNGLVYVGGMVDWLLK